MEETTTNNNTTTTTEETDPFKLCLNAPDYWFLHWKHSKQIHMTIITLALGATCLIPEKWMSDNLRLCLDTIGVGLLFTRLFTRTTADNLQCLYYDTLKRNIQEQYAKRQNEICACREKIMNENIIITQQQ